MNNLYNRILKRLAEHHITDSFNDGYALGVERGLEAERREIVKRLESLEIDKFNNTAVTLGYNTALELVKER